MPNPVPVQQGSTIPATPAAGTASASPLISVPRYRILTNDVLTKDQIAEGAIADATSWVARACNRTLIFGQFTERLYVYQKGYVFPSALPIAQVDAPIDADIQGFAVWIGFYLPLPEMPVWSGVIPPQSDVTYWGGFDSTTLPVGLADLIAKVAWYYANPTAMLGLSGGASNVHVGSIGFSGGENLSQLVKRDPEIRRGVEAYTRPQAHAWQS